jgi:hypothetical protein
MKTDCNTDKHGVWKQEEEIAVSTFNLGVVCSDTSIFGLILLSLRHIRHIFVNTTTNYVETDVSVHTNP